MIILRLERELVDVQDWDAVTGLPGYSANVDPTTVKLKEIIGSYYLPNEVPCGLTCREPHKRGYVVSTESEIVTNLGHVCGKKHFPDANFDQMRRVFDKDVRMKSYRETITAFKQRIPEIVGNIEELRQVEHGGDWSHRCLQRFKTPGNGIDSVRHALGKMSKENAPRIVNSRLATAEEREAISVGEGRPISGAHYIEEEVGYLAGLAALNDENDLRQILIVDLGTRLPEIEALNVETATESVLQREARWIAEVERKLERAVDSIATAQIFLTKRNLRQLEVLAKGERERAAFRTLINDLPLGQERTSSG